MYTIDFDERRRILHVTAEGFWTLATLATFSAAILARGAAVKLRHGEFAALNDVRRFPVQSPDVVRGIEFLKAQAARISSAPSATVVGSHLSKIQAERALKADHVRVFLDYDEATAWLEAAWVRKLGVAA